MFLSMYISTISYSKYRLFLKHINVTYLNIIVSSISYNNKTDTKTGKSI
jgi:hypothetical protein